MGRTQPTVFTPTQAIVATILGGPWLGPILLSASYYEIEERLVTGVLICVAIVALALALHPVLPGGLVLSYIVSGVAHIAASFDLNKLLRQRAPRGWDRRPWRYVGFSILGVWSVIASFLIYVVVQLRHGIM